MTVGGDETRGRLLSEARDLYLDVGLARFSLREVARRAGVSAAAVYRHFESKEALFAEVCNMGMEIFFGYLVRALSAKSARARLDACSHQYLRFALENSRDYRVIFMGDAQDLGALPTSSKERGPTYQFLVDRVRECMEAKILRDADADETATTIWAHVHGLVSLRIAGQLSNLGTDARFTKFYARSTDRLIAGLAP